MNIGRRLTIALCGIALVALTGLTPLQSMRAPSSVQQIKLGFSYLSSAQEKDLWRRADAYAEAEAFLKQCGSPSHVERRMMLAARDCIEMRALQKVAGYFRRKMGEFSKRTFICDSPEAKKLLKRARDQIDRDVAEVRSMCRACLIC
jgi:hypothetical protein